MSPTLVSLASRARFGIFTVSLLGTTACGGSADEAPATDEGHLEVAAASTASVCVANGPGLPSAGKRFELVSGNGHHEKLKFKNFDLLYDEGQNKIPLTVNRDGKLLFQAIALVPDPGTTGHLEITMPLTTTDSLTVVCEPKSDGNHENVFADDTAGAAPAPICTAAGSGTELGDGKRFDLLPGAVHREQLKYKNLEFFLEEGKNKIPLTVKRDGNVLFQAIGLIPDPGTVEEIHVVVPLDATVAVDVQCEAQ